MGGGPDHSRCRTPSPQPGNRGRPRRAVEGPGVNVQDDPTGLGADEGEDADGAQLLGDAVDEEQEYADARQAGVGAQQGGQPRGRLAEVGDHAQRVGVGEDEEGQGEFRPAVAEDQGDHAGRQLGAGDLHGHKQHREDEDDESQQRVRQSAGHGSNPIDANRQRPPGPVIEPLHRRDREQGRPNTEERKEP